MRLLAPPGAPTAAQMADDVRAGRRTARELTDAALARIAEVDGALCAFSSVLAEEAREAADAVDRRPPEQRGPLAGVPVAVKAEIDLAGQVTTAGGRAGGRPAAGDAELVRRLRAAGAVIVGSTAMAELGAYPFTEAALTGLTRNPWAPDRTPGGSSGGSAVAVASGCVPLAIGSDGGGSIRIPASCCGLVGLKPGRGRVSTAPHADLWGTLGVVGPLARTVGDVALALDVLTGLGDDGPRATAVAGRRARVGWVTTPPRGPVRVAPSVAAAVEQAAERLSGAGHEVVEVAGRWPDVQASFVPQYLSAVHLSARQSAHPDRLEPLTRAIARAGSWVRDPVLRDAVARGRDAHRRLLGRFAGYDALLAPTLACLPPPAGQLTGAGMVRALWRSLPMISFTTLANVTGLPAISVPAGCSPDGIPVGVQLVGLDADERALLAVAADLAR